MLEEGETDEQAARREIEEESGLTNLELIDDLGSYERPRILKDGSYDPAQMKTIHMFLFAAPPHAAAHGSHETVEAAWISFREVAASLEDAKDRAWFTTVFDRVREAIQRD